MSRRSRCAFLRISTSPTNPLRGSCVSKLSGCVFLRIFIVGDEPSAAVFAPPRHDHHTCNTARYVSLANVKLIAFGIIGVEFENAD